MTRGWFRGLNLDSGRSGIRALRSAGFRRYAAVQLLSSISVSSQMVAELWLVYEITERGLSLGTSTAIRTAPALVLAGLAGSLADRFPRKVLLTMTQAARCVIAAMFVLVTLGDLPSISTVYLLVLGLGCVHGIDQPVRRALVRDVVNRSELPSAASLHTATISVGGIIGPLCAGLLLTQIGPAAGFVFSSASALAAVVVVQFLRLVKEPSEESSPAETARRLPRNTSDPAPRHSGEEPAADLIRSRNPFVLKSRLRPPSITEQSSGSKDAATPAIDEPPGHRRARLAHILSPGLRPTFLLLLALSVFAMNLNVLLPVIAAEVLGGGSGTYSVLHTCLRAGALVGSLFAAMWATRTADHRRIFVALVLCGAALMSVAAGTQAIVTAVTIVVTGACVGLFLSMASASVQTGADRAIQGRQVAVYSFIFIGGRSLGAPLTGWMADQLGARWTTLMLGAGTLLGALAAQATFRNRRATLA